MKKLNFTLFTILILMVSIQVMAQPGSSIALSTKDTLKVASAKIPLEGFDQTWINGNDRRDSSIFHIPYFTPSILIDNNFTHSFNNPIDQTVVGSTALSRDDEMVISAVNFGGDFSYGNARGRIMTQFGERSEVVPRNDLSTYRGQYDMSNAYRYLDEAYAGYHFDKWYGINVDAGLFMSYIGLNSYYQEENWEYQASFTSDNTPWFFNGIRIQMFPTKCLKVEAWLINGWQSYGMFNQLPGVGGNITWCHTENSKILSNDYWGTDDAGFLGRHRFHSDNSYLWRYYHKAKSEKGITQMAFSATGDIGFEKGDGVNGFNNSDPINNPAQYFLSFMVYNRVWFHHNKLAWCAGGGWVDNPGRYLVLAPTGDASPLPNPANPTQTLGTHPFSENPGDQFVGWDCSTGISWMPNQSIEFKTEWVHRQSSVPYFAGEGGVTSPSGYSTTPIPPGWTPDLVRSENRIVVAFEFRL
ncbi:MAG: outer membrane beta-barrel protein [Bacteroidia bacterium]